MKRATIYFKYFMLYNIISIHALVKRATDDSIANPDNANISIHALVKRATSTFSTDTQREEKHFNPRPREEGDSMR